MRSLYTFAALALSLITVQASVGQSPFAGMEALFTPPKQYSVNYTSQLPNIDGDLSDAVWQKAAWTDVFTDIEGSKQPAPAYATRVKMLWSDSALYVAAELIEPHVWSKLLQFDTIIFQDNDFEIFIDPDNDTHTYFEIEVNARNTIFDLLLPKPYRNNGDALVSWNVDKLKSAVKIQGTLNNPSDTDKGWTVEMAIPYWALSTGIRPKMPKEGDFWRINFSRVEWDTFVENGQYIKKKDAKGRVLPEHNWVWSPQGLINMHYPERWGYLHFTKNNSPFSLPYAEKQKNYLWLVYYKQKQYHEKNGRYAPTLQALGIKENPLVDNQKNQLTLEATPHQFMAIIQGNDRVQWSINQDGLVRMQNPAKK